MTHVRLSAGIESVALTDCGTPSRDVTASSVVLGPIYDTWGSFTLPFTMPSYAQQYSSIAVHASGCVTFGSPGTKSVCYDNTPWGDQTVDACFPYAGAAAAVFLDGASQGQSLNYSPKSIRCSLCV